MAKRKGRAFGPAHPYTHRRRRSGRSPALPYPPRQRPVTLAQSCKQDANYHHFFTHIWSGFLNEATNLIWSGFLREATGVFRF